jgi:hypothetical protein
MNPPERYRIVVEGKGAPVSFIVREPRPATRFSPSGTQEASSSKGGSNAEFGTGELFGVALTVPPPDTPNIVHAGTRTCFFNA